MVFENLSNCPLCVSEKICYLLESDYDTDRNLFDLLGVRYQKSKWWHCQSCNHVFLNPRFTVAIESRLYGKESLYRKYSMRGMSQESYLQLIDSTIGNADSVHQGHANLLEKLFELVPKNEIRTILDFGAGFGAASSAIESFGYEYIGLELDDWCIAIAKTLKRNVDKLSKNENAKYDLIYTSQVFEHIQLPESVFEFLKNKLNTSGYLFINVPTHEWKKFANLSGAGLACMNWGHYHSYSSDSLKELLLRNGFNVRHIWYRGGDISVLAQIMNKDVPQKHVRKVFSTNNALHRVNILKLSATFRIIFMRLIAPVIVLKKYTKLILERKCKV